ncbi:MAG TPA: phosphonate ABC transporter ATP-binding protein [Magnetospirillaceae bacterium]|nr:phosphonate ABC transporter ATP-binding protein [Magnetospirillaceae bacterium]
MIRFTNVSKTYPNGVQALKGINLTVNKGEFVAILGLSGAGKSTLLRLINQLIDATEGEVEVNGVSVNKASGKILRKIRRQIGMIFQGFNIVKRMSVLSNVLAGRVAYHSTWRTILGLFPENDKQIAYRALKRVDILEKVHARASQLSGGQQQRVAIARALAQEPLLMLADEPVASLDPVTTIQVMTYLKKINREDGITTVANLHHVDLAMKYATRVVGIRAGTIVYDKQLADLDEEQFYRDMELVYGRRLHADEVLGEEE